MTRSVEIRVNDEEPAGADGPRLDPGAEGSGV